MLGQTVSENAILEPCPDKPNCVSTQADPSDKIHYLKPLAYTADAKDVLAAAESVLLAMPRSQLESKTGMRLELTFRSRVFRFVDDVIIVLDEANQQLHFRSAARMGHSDIGVNRKRMKEFVVELKEVLPQGSISLVD